MANDNEKKVPEVGEEQVPEGQEQPRYRFVRRVALRIRPGFVLRKVGQAHMIMPTGPRMKEYEGMITMNETGAFLFKETEKPDATKTKLIEDSIAQYGATQEEAEQAVEAFMDQCMQCNLLEFDDFVLDLQENKAYTAEEFKEMKENEQQQ